MIVPYVSVLALMVALGEACANLQMTESEGFLDRYGFYEAVDLHAPSRVPAIGSVQCSGEVLHGPSPGDELSVTGLSHLGPAHVEEVWLRGYL